jgi:hypothetical protein
VKIDAEDIGIYPVVYIRCREAAMRDKIEQSINGFASGDENFCVSVEEIISAIDDDNTDTELKDFLVAVMDKIPRGNSVKDDSIGDIIFHA